ncbi:hypothetical protein BBOU_0445 [Bifidobacterium boum]|uniref:Uncharacterized protein n=1 Tax=Bifidobacterium boum TaxID=78343 RepID=A0A086ZP65_9BIFI|nr:hypothetical protein BBOU_0445 [Bifidobacterium boum]
MPHKHKGAAQFFRIGKSSIWRGHHGLSGPIIQNLPCPVAASRSGCANTGGIGTPPVWSSNRHGMWPTPMVVAPSCSNSRYSRPCHPLNDLRNAPIARPSTRQPHRAVPAANQDSNCLTAKLCSPSWACGDHGALQYNADSTLHASGAPFSVANINASALSTVKVNAARASVSSLGGRVPSIRLEACHGQSDTPILVLSCR